MTQGFTIEALSSTLDRKTFSCRVEPLDRHLRELATQDVKRRMSNCFVALDEAGRIAGYYTFAASGIPLVELPLEITKRLPRYELVPAALIGRLAVDQRYQGRRLGSALLVDAIVRAARSNPAIFALLVEAKDEMAAAFYQRHGFQPFASKQRTFYAPIASALAALSAASE